MVGYPKWWPAMVVDIRVELEEPARRPGLGRSGGGGGTEEAFYTGIKPADGRDGGKSNPDANPRAKTKQQVGIERVGRTQGVAHEG
jgi:hypothetical protein